MGYLAMTLSEEVEAVCPCRHMEGVLNMDDDLHVSSGMATIFHVVRKINRLIVEKELDKAGTRRIIDAFKRIDAVLNIFEFEQRPQDSEVKRLMQEREEARRRKDWKLADQIRKRLTSMGVEVRDRKIS